MSVPYLVAQNTPKPVPFTPSSAAISGLSDKGREAISAAQIAHPEFYYDNFRDASSKIFEDATQPSSPPRVSVPNSGKSVSRANIPVIEFINADLAKHYGMSKETAYQEALSNTAYQRSVKDMQAAGLNPAVLFGAGKGSPSDGVYSVRSASSGGSSRGSSGSSKNNGKLFSSGEFYGISAAAGLVSAIASRNPNSYWIGQTVAQGFMTAFDSLFRK